MVSPDTEQTQLKPSHLRALVGIPHQHEEATSRGEEEFREGPCSSEADHRPQSAYLLPLLLSALVSSAKGPHYAHLPPRSELAERLHLGSRSWQLFCKYEIMQIIRERFTACHDQFQ